MSDPFVENQSHLLFQSIHSYPLNSALLILKYQYKYERAAVLCFFVTILRISSWNYLILKVCLKRIVGVN